MIYLFNSAYRPLYRDNILKTLLLPNGCVNDYRYSITGDVRHVPSNFISRLEQIKVGEPVTIIFNDRFSPGNYSYHPIRSGKYLSHRVENQRLFITVTLLDFLYPRNIENFNSYTRKPLLDLGTPKLTNDDPECTNDGYYCVYEQNIFQPLTEYITGDEAWSLIVKSLSSTKAYESKPDNLIIFIRAKLLDSKGNSITPATKESKTLFDIVRNHQYQLDLTYRFPIQLIDKTITTQAKVNLDDPPFRLVNDPEVTIDSVSNNLRIAFTTKKYPEETTGNLSLSFAEGIDASKASIELNIVETKSFWPEVALYILLFSLCSVIIAADFSKIQPLTLANFICNTWLKFIFAFIQAFTIFRLARLFGKNVF